MNTVVTSKDEILKIRLVCGQYPLGRIRLRRIGRIDL